MKELNKDEILNYIAGMLDSDGSICIPSSTAPRISFSSQSRITLQYIRDFFNLHGIESDLIADKSANCFVLYYHSKTKIGRILSMIRDRLYLKYNVASVIEEFLKADAKNKILLRDKIRSLTYSVKYKHLTDRRNILINPHFQLTPPYIGGFSDGDMGITVFLSKKLDAHKSYLTRLQFTLYGDEINKRLLEMFKEYLRIGGDVYIYKRPTYAQCIYTIASKADIQSFYSVVGRYLIGSRDRLSDVIDINATQNYDELVYRISEYKMKYRRHQIN